MDHNVIHVPAERDAGVFPVHPRIEGIVGSPRGVGGEGGSAAPGHPAVRCEGGASLVCGCYTERGKACADTAICCPKGWWVARGSASSSRNCEALSTDADTLADRLVVALKLL